MKIKSQPTSESIIALNKYICEQSHEPHHCYEVGKVESAIHSAFYPGDQPYVHGGIIGIGAALCFYLNKAHAFVNGNKRTAVISAITFMNLNGWDLCYSEQSEKNTDALSDVIYACAAGKVDKAQLMEWFDNHKIRLD